METLVGTEGNDTLIGIDGREEIAGLGGDDIIFGGGGADFIEGGAGADRIDGGGGPDTLFFIGSTAGVSFNLATGTGSGGDAEGDTYTSIRDVIGSDHDDILTGSFRNEAMAGGLGDDSLFGGAGDDTLVGGLGADLIDGGRGYDVVSYQLARGSVVVSLDGSAGTAGEALGDVLTGIEVLAGSFFDDALSGNSEANLIYASGGNDTVSGGGGNDTLDGVSGDDTLRGGDGDDSISGGGGRDRIYGGDGADTMFSGFPRGGNDLMFGGNGDDIFRAGNGEIMNGGAGADHFDFQDIGLNVTSTIADFEIGVDVCTINLVGLNNASASFTTSARGEAMLLLDLIDWVPNPTRIVFRGLTLEDISLDDLVILADPLV